MPEQIGQLFFHGKRNLVLHQGSNKPLCLLIGTKKHCSILQILSCLQPLLQKSGNLHILFSWIVKFHHLHRFSLLIWRRQPLLKADLVAAHHIHGCLKYIFRTAIINVQKNRFCLRIIFGKVQHDLWLGATEMINRLIIVSHYEQVIPGLCQHPYNIILEMVDILKFIYHNVLEFVLPCRQDIFSLDKKFIAAKKHVIEIQFSSLTQGLLIPIINLAEYLIWAAGRIIVIQGNPPPFYHADFLCHILLEISLLSQFLTKFQSHFF